MAHSQGSTTSSGYWGSQASTALVKLHYACYWLDSCQGRHELNQCDPWEAELRGKLGIYYAPSGDYKLYTRDALSSKNLENNRTGCTKVYLLIYNVDQKEILFGLTCKESKYDQCESLFLTFPSAHPRQRNEPMLQIPSRAFHWLTKDIDFANQCLEQGLKNRFLFLDANVIYPVHLNNEQISKLMREFVPNEQLQSLHCFSLAKILSQLPPWPKYIKEQETKSELAQIHKINSIGIKLGEYQLRSVISMCLMCIREHLSGGFETFLKV